MGTYYESYDVDTGHFVDKETNDRLVELAEKDGLTIGQELKKIVTGKDSAAVKKVNCYTYTISQEAHDILKEMAKEDHVSMTTEIENAISGWYRFRHGFTGLDEKNKEIKELQNDLLRTNFKLQQSMLFSSLKTPPTYLETGHK